MVYPKAWSALWRTDAIPKFGFRCGAPTLYPNLGSVGVPHLVCASRRRRKSHGPIWVHAGKRWSRKVSADLRWRSRGPRCRRWAGPPRSAGCRTRPASRRWTAAPWCRWPSPRPRETCRHTNTASCSSCSGLPQASSAGTTRPAFCRMHWARHKKPHHRDWQHGAGWAKLMTVDQK